MKNKIKKSLAKIQIKIRREPFTQMKIKIKKNEN